MAPTWVEAVIAPVNVRVKNRLSTRNSGSAVTAEDSALSEKINQITLQQAAEKAWRLKQNWHQFVKFSVRPRRVVMAKFAWPSGAKLEPGPLLLVSSRGGVQGGEVGLETLFA